MLQQSIIVKNQLIVYTQTGKVKPDKSPLLFLHGWRSSHAVWTPVIQKLSADGYTCYALDLAGFGGSEAPKTSFSVSDYVDIILAFLEKLKIPKVVLIGHSFGGRIAIKLAAEYGNILEKLILVDSGGIRKASLVRDMKTAIAKTTRPIFGLPAFQGLRAKIYHLLGADDYLATPALRETFLNVVGEDLQDDLSRIQTPTLIVWGDKDRETRVNDGEQMYELVSGSKLVVLQGAKHFSFLDKPEEFYNTVLEFIS